MTCERRWQILHSYWLSLAKFAVHLHKVKQSLTFVAWSASLDTSTFRRQRSLSLMSPEVASAPLKTNVIMSLCRCVSLAVWTGLNCAFTPPPARASKFALENFRGRSDVDQIVVMYLKEPQSKQAHWFCADWPQLGYRLSWNILNVNENDRWKLNNYSCMFANEINQLKAICGVWLLSSRFISTCSL